MFFLRFAIFFTSIAFAGRLRHRVRVLADGGGGAPGERGSLRLRGQADGTHRARRRGMRNEDMADIVFLGSKFIS